MIKYRYIIQCERMRREEAFVADDMQHLFRLLQDYMMTQGPIVILYNVGRV